MHAHTEEVHDRGSRALGSGRIWLLAILPPAALLVACSAGQVGPYPAFEPPAGETGCRRTMQPSIASPLGPLPGTNGVVIGSVGPGFLLCPARPAPLAPEPRGRDGTPLTGSVS